MGVAAADCSERFSSLLVVLRQKAEMLIQPSTRRSRAKFVPPANGTESNDRIIISKERITISTNR